MIKVYYCDVIGLVDYYNLIEILPDKRKEYVLSISDVNRQKQSVLVWVLLEKCLSKFHQLTNLDFEFDQQRWKLKNTDLDFSISHSKNFITVAIGESPVGVDVEICDSKILKLKSKFCNSDDIGELTERWTRKESLFKARKGKNFNTTKIFDEVGHEYKLTVCSDSEEAEFIKVDKNFLF